jgi:hypothetical protein
MENQNVETKPAKEVTLTVTLDEANLLLAGLGELPAKVSLALIDKVRQQAVQQLNVEETAENVQ